MCSFLTKLCESLRYHSNSKISYTREQFYKKIVAKQFLFISSVLKKQSDIFKLSPSSAFQKVKYACIQWSSIVASVQHNSWCNDTGQKHCRGHLMTPCTRLYTEIPNLIRKKKKAIVMGRLLHLHLGNVPPFPSAQRKNRNETMKIYEKLKLSTGKFLIYILLKSAAPWQYCIVPSPDKTCVVF